MHYFRAFFVSKHLFSALFMRNPRFTAVVLWATFKENRQRPSGLNRPGHALIPLNLIRLEETYDSLAFSKRCCQRAQNQTATRWATRGVFGRCGSWQITWSSLLGKCLIPLRGGGPLTLDNISCEIQPGEFVAFVGPSGSGKSTILRLLLGFEECEQGRILFDGQDLSGLDVLAVRRQIGTVLQHGRLNTGSIFENISNNSKISHAEAWEAIADAGMTSDLENMPMGLHTMVAEGGGNLSGGQRQRLLIARALATRPKIVFFDEATSALDNKTQSIVSSALTRRKVTRVVIAHRLSTIQSADKIYVLNHGRLIQSGGFKELSENEGFFRNLVMRQLA